MIVRRYRIRESYGTLMELLWNRYGTVMELLWSCYGTVMPLKTIVVNTSSLHECIHRSENKKEFAFLTCLELRCLQLEAGIMQTLQKNGTTATTTVP
jgi:hypothetical protein